MSRRPICFLATDNAEQAKTFYADVLGLPLVEVSPYALVFDDAGMMLRVQIVETVVAPPYTAYGWHVDDIVAEIAHLAAQGIPCLQFAHLPQNSTGIWTSPDDAQIAWFKDPCGHTLSFTQFPGVT